MKNKGIKNLDHLPKNQRDYFTLEEHIEILYERARDDSGKFKSIAIDPKLIFTIIETFKAQTQSIERLEKERDVYKGALRQLANGITSNGDGVCGPSVDHADRALVKGAKIAGRPNERK